MLCQKSLLIIEDDPSLRDVLLQYLSVYYEVKVASGFHSAEVLLSSHAFAAILLDQNLPDGNGLDFLPRILQLQPASAVLMMTGEGDLNAAVKALDMGAHDYVIKSKNLIPHLLVRIPVALKHAAVCSRAEALDKRPEIALPVRPEDFSEHSYRAFLETSEKIYLQAALNAFDGNVGHTAEKLNVSRSTVFRKLSEYRIGRVAETSQTSMRKTDRL